MDFTRARCGLCALPCTVVRQSAPAKPDRPVQSGDAYAVARFDRGLWSKLCKNRGDGVDPRSCPDLTAAIAGPKSAGIEYTWRVGRE